jgi:hypothetical protein
MKLLPLILTNYVICLSDHLILDTKIQVPVLATFLDGELGIRYRGYSIDLAAKGHFLEVSYLLFLVSCQLWRN